MKSPCFEFSNEIFDEKNKCVRASCLRSVVQRQSIHSILKNFGKRLVVVAVLVEIKDESVRKYDE